jgi:hypothetical protein
MRYVAGVGRCHVTKYCIKKQDMLHGATDLSQGGMPAWARAECHFARTLGREHLLALAVL